MKKILSLGFLLVAAATLVVFGSEYKEVEGYYVSVDINPSVEFIVDEEDIVESFIFLNEDAAILCSDLDFIGMNIDDAVELFIETATAAGYVDPEGNDNAVLITVIGEDGDEEEIGVIRERIRKRIVSHFARNYINAVVLSEDFTQEDLVAEAEILGVSPGKLKLAYSVTAIDETYIIDDLLEMPVKDLMSLVKELHGDEWQLFLDENQETFEGIKNRLTQRYQERIDTWLENHPDMTEEDLKAAVEEKLQENNRFSRRLFDNIKEQWQQRRNQENNEDTDELTS